MRTSEWQPRFGSVGRKWCCICGKLTRSRMKQTDVALCESCGKNRAKMILYNLEQLQKSKEQTQ